MTLDTYNRGILGYSPSVPLRIQGQMHVIGKLKKHRAIPIAVKAA